ncbi:hypothetical protein H072_6372 [Dactylellina haptotyla CBS 200.50]|uniref:Uncharacterized protein n=1 Tax=Dactylellina haptotyla (strain CBS 200.50) TaxID=1284197 RepID=S8BKG4_DACHA|nr:hypothetical protein H072_6372 [Dactylellina haptotyla CBS 200.50]
MPSANHLETVPDDIKFLILLALPDIRSLNALCAASSAYSRVREDFKFSIENEIYFTDALKYSRESVWVAAHRGTLYRYYATEDEVQSAIDEYTMYPRPILLESGRIGLDGCYGAKYKLLREKIVANHRYIMDLYDELADRDIEKHLGVGIYLPLEDISAEEREREETYRFYCTPGEEKRIVTALYRSWILSLMTCQHKSTIHKEWYLSVVFASWSFWDFMCVRAVQRILWGEINNLIDYAIFNNADMLAIEGEQELLDYARRFTDTTTSLVLLHDFPANMAVWFLGNEDAPATLDERKEVTKRTRDLLDVQTCAQLDIPVPSHCFFRLHYEYLMRSVDEHAYIRCSDFKKRRICKPGQTVDWDVVEGKKVWIRGSDMTEPENSGIDLNACVWDGWRLKSWGFTYPY